jgi:type 1 fimbriae regulatory protein FimB/type 1 fimbriae regulatory protein FimE
LRQIVLWHRLPRKAILGNEAARNTGKTPENPARADCQIHHFEQSRFAVKDEKPGRQPPPKRKKGVAFNRSRRSRDHLTEDEVDRLMKAARKQGEQGHRNATMILIAFRHGLRVSELVELDWSQIDFQARTLWVNRLKKSNPAMHTLERDEIAALRKLGGERSTGTVFLSERGRSLSRRTFCHIVAKAGISEGLPLSVTPHMLRHSCGYALGNRGWDTRMVQDWLGHRQIQHTVKYTAMNPERFRNLWSRRPA